MESKKEPIGLLFGNVSYYSEEHLNAIINDMEYEQSLFFIVRAVEFSYNSGIYSLTESEIISKSLRIFLQKNNKNDEGGEK
jgi:hypothetical protein